MSKVTDDDISKNPSAPYSALASSDPVIVTAVAVEQYPSNSGAVISVGGDDSQENLMDIVRYLEQELGLNGPVISVVDEACRQLGVSSGGATSSLYERAIKCRDIIQGKPTTSAGTIGAGNYHEPNSGPRADQLGAFKWFEDQGWKDKWPVHYASMKGQVEEIIRLVQQSGRRPDEKMTDWFDSEPVGWAASFGQLGALRCLIDLGAYPFTVNKAGNTALTDAKRERHEGCIAFLENYQKSPGSGLTGMKMDRGGGAGGRTAVAPNPALNGELNSTARNTNDTAKIRDLVARGAVLDSVNDGNWRHTALHQACYHGRPAIVRTLLELGAYEKCAHLASNPCGRGGSGKPIELARGGGHHEIVNILEEYSRNGCIQSSADKPTATSDGKHPPGWSASYPYIPASEIAGCWGCICFAGLPGLAIFHKQFVSEDELSHSGCVILPLPLYFCGERRIRVPNTNGFYKADERNNVDTHSSSSCVSNGRSCSMKFFSC